MQELKMELLISNYIATNNQKHQRYNSWNHCFKAFGSKLDDDFLALHLAFYLASWGMYRGSSKLLSKDYTIHIGAVAILNNFSSLRCNNQNENDKSELDEINKLISSLFNYYDSHDITPTDTLLSKIILGTLGCLPAFDRFFKDGVKSEKLKFTNLNNKSLEHLFDFTENNSELKAIKEKYPDYPIMKIVDMYFWQIGFDLNNSTE